MGCKILERNYVGVDKGAVGHYYINMFIAVEAEREDINSVWYPMLNIR